MDTLQAAVGTPAPSEPNDLGFDFDAFLREDALGAAVASAGQSSEGLSNSSADSPSLAGSGAEVVRASSAKLRHERKGHTKSRMGCYNCKRRRIKVCIHCARTGAVAPLPSLSQKEKEK